VEFSFGDHVLDLDRRELRRGAELIAVEPQVFDLLVYLVRNRDPNQAATVIQLADRR
jgi:DNA-binding winged helix-turn-helix (wHTH) protein